MKNRKRVVAFVVSVAFLAGIGFVVYSTIETRKAENKAHVDEIASDIEWFRKGPHTEAEETRRAIEKNTAALKARR